MELSPLLVVGIVLLVLVVALSLRQRSQQVDRTAGGPTNSPHGASGGRPAVVPPGPAAASAGDAASKYVFSKDELLGEISFIDGLWTADDDVPFADTTVFVEVQGHRAGLTDAQRELLRLALKYPRDLDGRAREVIQRELDRQGIADTKMELYELAVHPRDDGPEAGFLWYEVEAGREMGVSSTDGWKTLRLEAVRD